MCMSLMELRYVFEDSYENFKVKNVAVGKDFLIMAGPCSVENREQLFDTAKIVISNGANIIRGGAFKPRTSPYSFQGLGEEALKLLKEVGDMYNIPIVSEIVDVRDIDLMSKYVDILQVGARNMQNFSLLKELGKIDKPILLKNGISSTLEEWLGSAEYILSGGNSKVILCERGIRTTETSTRNTLDLSIVCSIKRISKLPIIVDVSHGTGNRELSMDMSSVSVLTGADGLMFEVHNNPSLAWSDGNQSLNEYEFSEAMVNVRKVRDFYVKEYRGI